VENFVENVYNESDDHRIIDIIFDNVETQDKEFIRLLKEEMRKELNDSFGNESNWINWHEEIIDKLAGDKLKEKTEGMK
jgi:hypothetical protein